MSEQSSLHDSFPFRVAVDMDGVLTGSPVPLAHAANEHFGLDLPDIAFVDSSGLNVSLEVREWVYGPDGPAFGMKPAPGAQDFFQGLVELAGADNVIIVTARPESSAEMTLRWLRKQGFPHTHVIFADDKTGIAKRQGCRFAIEDSLRHARNYASGEVSCFLINRDPEEVDTGNQWIVPVNSFDDILSLLAAERRAPVSSSVISSLPPIMDGQEELTRRWKVVVSDTIHSIAREHIEAVAEVIDVDGTNPRALIEALHDADALVVRSETLVTSEVLAAGPRLRVVARAGVGVDNIDVEAATRAGVVVLNAPGANAFSAGEHTIALLLAVTRQIPFANQTTHAGEWQRKLVKPIDIRGRTVGIVGLGRVGTVVAKRLKAFEANVIAYDPYIPTARFADAGAEQVELEEIWKRSDIVTFHCPATSENTRMLNAETLAKMRPGSIVINAGRGELVDEYALAEALRSGHIRAAGIDVFPAEPCVESPLFGLENVVLTPHTGGSSEEALLAVGRVIGSTTVAALRGEAVSNAVNLPDAALEAPALRLLTSVAAAAGKLLSVLAPDHVNSVSVEARGMVSNDIMEHVASAALAESLKRWLGRRVTPVNARLIASEIGIDVMTAADDGDETSIPQFRFEVRGDTTHSVVVSWDRDIAGIVEVDRFSLAQPLEGYVLITHHEDRPGIIGKLSTTLARYNINIAGMQVSRVVPRGEAMMVTNVDEEIPEEALGEIRAIEGLENAFIVSLPGVIQERPDPVHLVASITGSAYRGK
jgi:D-3-phosphoglycerate dehydrogenase / 2-oxoglutarate reductase